MRHMSQVDWCVACVLSSMGFGLCKLCSISVHSFCVSVCVLYNVCGMRCHCQLHASIMASQPHPINRFTCSCSCLFNLLTTGLYHLITYAPQLTAVNNHCFIAACMAPRPSRSGGLIRNKRRVESWLQGCTSHWARASPSTLLQVTTCSVVSALCHFHEAVFSFFAAVLRDVIGQLVVCAGCNGVSRLQLV